MVGRNDCYPPHPGPIPCKWHVVPLNGSISCSCCWAPNILKYLPSLCSLADFREVYVEVASTNIQCHELHEKNINIISLVNFFLFKRSNGCLESLGEWTSIFEEEYGIPGCLMDFVLWVKWFYFHIISLYSLNNWLCIDLNSFSLFYQYMFNYYHLCINFFQSLRVYYLKNSSRTTIWACDFEKEYGKVIHLWIYTYVMLIPFHSFITIVLWEYYYGWF